MTKDKCWGIVGAIALLPIGFGVSPEAKAEDSPLGDALEVFRQQRQYVPWPLGYEEETQKWRDTQEAWSRFNSSVAPFVGHWYHGTGNGGLTIYPSPVKGEACVLDYTGNPATVTLHRGRVKGDRLRVEERWGAGFLMREREFLGLFASHPEFSPPRFSVAGVYNAPKPLQHPQEWLRSRRDPRSGTRPDTSKVPEVESEELLAAFEEMDCIVAPPPFQATPPVVPPLPQPLPSPRDPDPLIFEPEIPVSNIGIGHLRPKDLSVFQNSGWTQSPLLGVRWLHGVILPLYDHPNGQHWGWLVNGWLVRNGETPIPLGGEGNAIAAKLTYYALNSLPILETRGQGWFLLRYSLGVGSPRTAWIHESHFNLGEIEVAVQSWQDRFLEYGWIYFVDVNSERAQALRTGPDRDRPLQAWVGHKSFIEPLEFRGDWMRVRVTQPTVPCVETFPEATTQEGWMQWRSIDRDSWIWYPPKGC